MKIGLSGDTSVAAASVRNRSLQDLTRWERRKPEAYLDPKIPFIQNQPHLPFNSWKLSLKNCQEMSRPVRFLAMLPIRWTES